MDAYVRNFTKVLAKNAIDRDKLSVSFTFLLCQLHVLYLIPFDSNKILIIEPVCYCATNLLSYMAVYQ